MPLRAPSDTPGTLYHIMVPESKEKMIINLTGILLRSIPAGYPGRYLYIGTS